ncbi:hypothetical protein WBG78_04495 [Chryseolinea sp. T2]|uniref:hypothetical protein n=1 Tax=Chryseolinea sp. T2 TaxID=3129255 RepID=UPI0030778800
MDLFRTIVRSGIEERMTYKTKRSILISNYLSLILTVAINAVFIFRLTVFSNPHVDIHWILGTIIFTSPIFMNRLHLTTAGRLVLCIGPILFLWYSFIGQMHASTAIEVSQYDGLRIFLLGVSFVPYLIFDRSQLPLLILGILPSLLSVLFFNKWMNLAGLDISERISGDSDYQIMWMRTLVSYLVISAGCISFQSIISYNDRLTEKLMLKVRGNLEKIEDQNRALLRQSHELNMLNSDLGELVEKKTRSIRDQNDMLVKLSFTNAHKVRGPVARILGLISVSRLNTDLNSDWIFDKVEGEARDIDEILVAISRDLDDSVRTHSSVNASHAITIQ